LAEVEDWGDRLKPRSAARVESRSLTSFIAFRGLQAQADSVENRSRHRSGATIFIAFRGLKAQVDSCESRP